MMVPTVQYTSSSGSYPNRLHDKLDLVSTTEHSSNHFAILDTRRPFGSSINSTYNSHEELSQAPSQATDPRQSIIASLLMQPSQTKFADGLLSVTFPLQKLTTEKELFLSVSRNTVYSDNSDNGLKSLQAINISSYSPVDISGEKYIKHCIYLIDKSQSFNVKELSDKEFTLRFRDSIGNIPALKSVPDSKCEEYFSVEDPAADYLDRSICWIQIDQGGSTVYIERDDESNALLICELSEKKLNNISGFLKNEVELFRLLNILLHDLGNYLNQPIAVENHQGLSIQRFLKFINLIFVTRPISELTWSKSFPEGEQHRYHHFYSQRSDAPIMTARQFYTGIGSNELKNSNENNELSFELASMAGLKRQQEIHHENKRMLSRNNQPGAAALGGSDNKFQTNSSIEVHNKIALDVYVNNIDVKNLSPSNNINFTLHENPSAFTRENSGVPNYLEDIKDEIIFESFRKHPTNIKNKDLSEITTSHEQFIMAGLNVHKEKAREVLSRYEFLDEGLLYTKEAFAVSVKEAGDIPAWAKSFEKIDADHYVSPFRESHVMDNGLYGFHGKDNYFYRVDNNRPETVLRNGFRVSEDYTAIPKMLPEDMDGIIVSESLEGARRYQTINKNSFIYRIKGGGVEGVSLKDNLYKNEKALNEFLGEPLEKKHSTIESLAADTNGAIYLDEVHLRKETIPPEAICVMPTDTVDEALPQGPWKKYL